MVEVLGVAEVVVITFTVLPTNSLVCNGGVVVVRVLVMVDICAVVVVIVDCLVVVVFEVTVVVIVVVAGAGGKILASRSRHSSDVPSADRPLARRMV